jgi:hypothetical protein
MAKKHIMDLPTNVPRLKKGAGLFDGEIYDETKAPNVTKKLKLEAFQDKLKEASKMPMKNIKPKGNFSGKVFGTDLNKFKKDKAEYTRKQGSLFNKEFYDIFRKGKPKIEDYSNPLPKPKKKLSI